MEELMNVLAIRNLEIAEQRARPNNRHNHRDPFIELSDRQFTKLFRLWKELVRHVVEILEPFLRPAVRATDLDITTKVLVALKFFASGSYQPDVGGNVYLDVSQSAVSNCIKEVTNSLLQPQVFNEWVKFPNNFEEIDRIRQRFHEAHGFPGVIIGCIDCTHVAIVSPGSDNPEFPEHVYVNRKNYHSINVQLVCDADLRITNICAKYPGSSNDAYIWSRSNLQTVLRTIHATGNQDYFLLGDSGYPLRTWLLTPFNVVEPGTPEENYNKIHKRTRVKIECCNGVLKARFRCLLKHRVLHYAPDVACKIISACAVLHNMCIAHNVEQPDEEIDEEHDLGMIEDVNVNREEVLDRRINPELADGKRNRMRIVRTLNRRC